MSTKTENSPLTPPSPPTSSRVPADVLRDAIAASSPDEISQLLGVHTSTLSSWLRSNQIPKMAHLALTARKAQPDAYLVRVPREHAPAFSAFAQALQLHMTKISCGG